MIDLIIFFLIYYGVFECHFFLLFRSKNLLSKHKLNVSLFEIGQIILILGVEELFFFIGDFLVYYVEDGVVVSHAYWKVILAQLIRYKHFLALLYFLYKQEFRKFDPAQNGLDHEDPTDSFKFD